MTAVRTILAAADQGLEFGRPEGWIWSLVAVAGLAALVAAALWRRRAKRRLCDPGLLPRIAPRIAGARTGLRAMLTAVALVAVAVAVLDPRVGERLEPVEQSGVDVMVVIDVSRSMLAEDAAPNRLARAKQFARDLVEALGSDRVGLVEFAGVPSMRCPLTFNHRTFLTQLDLLSPQSTVRGGSLLGDAVRLAAESLDAEGTGKAIVVLSDGEDMESAPVEAAATAAAERGVRVYAIGLGDKVEGARIPVREGGRTTYLVHEGEQVWTKLDPTLLAEVARAGGGAYLEAGTGQADMTGLARILSTGIGTRVRDRADVATRIPLFPWLAALAALALAIEPLVPARDAARNGMAKEDRR